MLGYKFKEAKKRVVRKFEKKYLDSLLTYTKGNVTRAAQHAGMQRSALQRLLRNSGLKAVDYKK